MTIAAVREWVAFVGAVLFTGLIVAMIVSGLRASARRRRLGGPALLSGGAKQPAEAHAPHSRPYSDARKDAPAGEEGPPSYGKGPDEDQALRDVSTLALLAEYRRRGLHRRRRERIQRRRDGICLGDEATEALLRDVFEDRPPDRGRR